jgi:integrase
MSSTGKSKGTGGADGTGPVRVADGVYKYGKSGLYAVIYRAGGKQIWVRGFTTLPEAKQARVRILADASRGKHVRPNKALVENFYEEWEKATRPTLRGSSATMRAHDFSVNIIPYFATRKLQDVRPDDIALWHAVLLTGADRKGRSQKPLSPRTVTRMHRELRVMFRDAVSWGRLAVNPCDAVKPPKFTPAEMHTWSGEQMGTFLAYVGEHVPLWRAMFVLAASSAARRGELVGVQWQDIDLGAGTWTVRRSIVRAISELHENTPKTPKGRRVVQLDAGTVAVLGEHRKLVAEAALAEGRADALAPTGRVFPGWLMAPGAANGRATRQERSQAIAMGVIGPEIVTNRFNDYAKAAGLPRIRLHDVRHSWATLALEAGLNPKIVQERLGHADISITLGTYSHVSESVHRDAAEQISRLFGPAAGKASG